MSTPGGATHCPPERVKVCSVPSASTIVILSEVTCGSAPSRPGIVLRPSSAACAKSTPPSGSFSRVGPEIPIEKPTPACE